MRIGMFTSGYQRSPLEHAFADAARFGYDYVELWGGRPHAFAPDLLAGDLTGILDLIQRYQVPVEVYTPEHNAYPYNYMIGSENQRLDAIAYLRSCLEVGQALGARCTTISAGHAGYATPRVEVRARLVRSLRELADHAERLDHLLVLEALTPAESNAGRSADDLAEVLDAVDSPRLAAMCDVVPPFLQHEPIIGYIDRLGDRLVHMHIVDSDGITDTHLVPGEGALPLRELMAELADAGYTGTATIELVTNYLHEPRLYARRAVANLRALMRH